ELALDILTALEAFEERARVGRFAVHALVLRLVALPRRRLQAREHLENASSAETPVQMKVKLGEGRGHAISVAACTRRTSPTCRAAAPRSCGRCGPRSDRTCR